MYTTRFEEKGKITCEATGVNGKKVSGILEINNFSKIGCYVNYSPDNEMWDATKDGVEETIVEGKYSFNIYDKSTNKSVNGLSKNESITCYNTSKPKYSGWRIMDINKETGQITLIHGGIPECFFNYDSGINTKGQDILKVRATSASDEGEAKAWTKYGNNIYAEGAHYMDADDVNIINKEENGNDDYKIVPFPEQDSGKCKHSAYYGGHSDFECGGHSQLISIGAYYFLASASHWDELITREPFGDSEIWSNLKTNLSNGVRPVIVLKPNVQLSQQESGLKGDEYSLIAS